MRVKETFGRMLAICLALVMSCSGVPALGIADTSAQEPEAQVARSETGPDEVAYVAEEQPVTCDGSVAFGEESAADMSLNEVVAQRAEHVREVVQDASLRGLISELYGELAHVDVTDGEAAAATCDPNEVAEQDVIQALTTEEASGAALCEAFVLVASELGATCDVVAPEDGSRARVRLWLDDIWLGVDVVAAALDRMSSESDDVSDRWLLFAVDSNEGTTDEVDDGQAAPDCDANNEVAEAEMYASGAESSAVEGLSHEEEREPPEPEASVANAFPSQDERQNATDAGARGSSSSDKTKRDAAKSSKTARKGAASATATETTATSKRDISQANVSAIGNQAYTSKAVTPKPTVRWGNTKLVSGEHYTLAYANNVKAGTASVTIRGKGEYAGSKRLTFKIVAPSVSYYVHRQTYGWEAAWSRRDGASSGTTGESKRLEAIRVRMTSRPVAGSILYKSHIQTSGWERSWRADGEQSGSVGHSKRLEAICIKLSGNMANLYDVYYRVHVQRFGWMAWAKNGAKSGSAGYSYRLEAIQIKLVPKGAAGPQSTTANPAFAQRKAGPQAKTGWQNPAKYPQVSSNTVVLPAYCTGAHTYVTPSRIAANATRSQCVEAFISRAYEYLGTPYREPWAREPGVGIDCSGLVLQCLYATGMDLEHARGTEKVGGYNPYNHYWVPEQCSNSMRWYENETFKPVEVTNIRRGDLVFTRGHVSIYLGDEQIIESISGKGVCIQQLNRRALIGAQRPFV